MTRTHWQVISRIYHQALGTPSEAREAFIREQCGGDERLEQEVRSLLAQPSSDSFLQEMLASRDDTPPSSPSLRGGRLGGYELRGLLGAGGMGEVYRAHDQRLGRDVAIKIVPEAFTSHPERLARFEREARVLAALSHPHIAAIYDVEEVARDGQSGHAPAIALVLELVEGPTLAERLRSGPIATAETIDFAQQIADGLEAAHEKGIVHRDLKPANIKIRPDGVVKILDFGLAKAEGLAAGAAAQGDTGSSDPTSAGVILGTPAYMSPEQARGLAVDKRTDIWAYGCVLYEMLTGRSAFRGETQADILTAVLHREPDWSALPDTTPPGLRRLVQRCLEKTSTRRLRDIGDARFDLDDDRGTPLPLVRAPHRRKLAWLAASALLIFTTAVGTIWIWPRSQPQAIQFALTAPSGHAVVSVPVPSPDGRQLVFVATTFGGESALWVRTLDSSSPRRIPGTEDAVFPFWSPDGRFVGFGAGGVLKRTAVAGGAVQRIADLDPAHMGATWNGDDVILFTPSNKAPLYAVRAAGGTPQPVTSLNVDQRENSHRWPHFLPDGRHFLFTARSDVPDQTGIYVGSLDNPSSPKRLLAAQSSAVYVSTGYLLFVRDNTLLAQPFDMRTVALSGEPVALAGDIRAETAAATAEFATSADGGVLAYNTAAASRLTWFDRTGTETATVAARGRFSQLRLSPDGSQAAVVMPDLANGTRDIWVISLANGSITRITSHPAVDWFPVWSPDGQEVLFASERHETPAFYRTRASGGGADQLMFRTTSPEAIFPTDWTLDGRSVVFHSYPRGDVRLLPLTSSAQPTPLVTSPFTDWTASFSPDGRWVAYVSDESGADEIYVKAVAGPERHRVSVRGGMQPRWRRDGGELFYISADGRLTSVTMRADERMTPGQPQSLFSVCENERDRAGRSPFMYRYDVVADGSRSLWICTDTDSMTTVAVHALSALANQ